MAQEIKYSRFIQKLKQSSAASAWYFCRTWPAPAASFSPVLATALIAEHGNSLPAELGSALRQNGHAGHGVYAVVLRGLRLWARTDGLRLIMTSLFLGLEDK